MLNAQREEIQRENLSDASEVSQEERIRGSLLGSWICSGRGTGSIAPLRISRAGTGSMWLQASRGATFGCF